MSLYSQNIGMEFGKEKCAMLFIRKRKKQMMEGIELIDQEKIEHPEKRKLTNTWKYLKWTPSNKWTRKEKLRNNTSGEREKYWKSNYIAEITSKG